MNTLPISIVLLLGIAAESPQACEAHLKMDGNTPNECQFETEKHLFKVGNFAEQRRNFPELEQRTKILPSSE